MVGTALGSRRDLENSPRGWLLDVLSWREIVWLFDRLNLDCSALRAPIAVAEINGYLIYYHWGRFPFSIGTMVIEVAAASLSSSYSTPYNLKILAGREYSAGGVSSHGRYLNTRLPLAGWNLPDHYHHHRHCHRRSRTYWHPLNSKRWLIGDGSVLDFVVAAVVH